MKRLSVLLGLLAAVSASGQDNPFRVVDPDWVICGGEFITVVSMVAGAPDTAFERVTVRKANVLEVRLSATVFVGQVFVRDALAGGDAWQVIGVTSLAYYRIVECLD